MRHDSENPDLHRAAFFGDVEKIEQCVKLGIDVNILDSAGNTPLKYASAEPYPLAVRKLIELGADVNLADNRGFTPLHCAAGHGFYPEAIEIAKLLIDSGANVNVRSRKFGFVPLHEAKGMEMIRLLIDSGADPFVKNDDGLTPLEYMIEGDETEDAEHLRKLIGSEQRS